VGIHRAAGGGGGDDEEEEGAETPVVLYRNGFTVGGDGGDDLFRPLTSSINREHWELLKQKYSTNTNTISLSTNSIFIRSFTSLTIPSIIVLWRPMACV
jgi:hypothetical protein